MSRNADLTFAEDYQHGRSQTLQADSKYSSSVIMQFNTPLKSTAETGWDLIRAAVCDYMPDQ